MQKKTSSLRLAALGALVLGFACAGFVANASAEDVTSNDTAKDVTDTAAGGGGFGGHGGHGNHDGHGGGGSNGRRCVVRDGRCRAAGGQHRDRRGGGKPPPALA